MKTSRDFTETEITPFEGIDALAKALIGEEHAIFGDAPGIVFHEGKSAGYVPLESEKQMEVLDTVHRLQSQTM